MRAAIQSFRAMFGFTELFSVSESGPGVRHAQLKLGTNVVMLGSVRPDEGVATPQSLGVATRTLYVYVGGTRRTLRTGAISGRAGREPAERHRLRFERVPRPRRRGASLDVRHIPAHSRTGVAV
jgi:uncharacterized glyoxalase superfamily protein PhnB